MSIGIVKSLKRRSPEALVTLAVAGVLLAWLVIVVAAYIAVPPATP